MKFLVQSCIIYAFLLQYENLPVRNKLRNYSIQILRKTCTRQTGVNQKQGYTVGDSQEKHVWNKQKAKLPIKYHSNALKRFLKLSKTNFLVIMFPFSMIIISFMNFSFLFVCYCKIIFCIFKRLNFEYYWHMYWGILLNKWNTTSFCPFFPKILNEQSKNCTKIYLLQKYTFCLSLP